MDGWLLPYWSSCAIRWREEGKIYTYARKEKSEGGRREIKDNNGESAGKIKTKMIAGKNE